MMFEETCPPSDGVHIPRPGPGGTSPLGFAPQSAEFKDGSSIRLRYTVERKEA